MKLYCLFATYYTENDGFIGVYDSLKEAKRQEKLIHKEQDTKTTIILEKVLND